MNKLKHFCFLLIGLVVFFSSCLSKVEDNYSVEKLNAWYYKGFDDEWREIFAEGSIQHILLRDTIIKSYYFDLDFYKNQWTDTVDWHFKTIINETKQNKKERVELVFEGIVGVADVFLNDSLIFTIDNMFRKYHYDITEILHMGQN
ncbi:MAG TPA: hypothetical protein ENN45_04210, partial [Bacteroidetes bacterium]|nr:hypothetical protein [Bacteroidota bacterium]